MRFTILLAVLFIMGTVSAQGVLPTIPESGASSHAFIPAGYDTLNVAIGDLNKDSLNDIVLVLKSLKEDTFDPAKDDIDSIPQRLLLVLLNNGKGYTLSGKSSTVVLCKECGGIFGDPFEGIEIKKGILIVEHYGGSNWRWSLTYKFRYQQHDFYLIGKTTLSFWDVAMCEKLKEYAGTAFKDENLVTGAYTEKKVSDEGCKLLVNKKGKQAIKPLIKLNEFITEN